MLQSQGSRSIWEKTKMPISSRTYKILIRLIFVCVLSGWIGQMVFIKICGEPYPALMMPGFTGTHTDESGTPWAKVVDIEFQFSSGKKVRITQDDLLSPIPTSHHAAIMSAMFSPDTKSKSRPSRSSSKTRFLYRLMPGLKKGTRDRETREHQASIRQWLVKRANNLVPGAGQPLRVDFIWYREKYTFLGGVIRAERTKEAIVGVDLNHE